jgi:hypothetical protein
MIKKVACKWLVTWPQAFGACRCYCVALFQCEKVLVLRAATRPESTGYMPVLLRSTFSVSQSSHPACGHQAKKDWMHPSTTP